MTGLGLTERGATGRSARAQAAMAHLQDFDPGLASLSLWCRIVDGGAGTLTSGEAIWIGEDFAALPLREQIGVLGHHVLHIALRHEGRMAAMKQRWGGAFDAKTYALAADAIVNECVTQAGHAVPRPAPLLADLLVQVLKETPPGTLADWDVDRLYIALMAMDGEGRRRQEAYEEATAFQPDIVPDASPEAGENDAEWRGRMIRAEELSAASGRGIGGVLTVIGDHSPASIPWETHLRRLLTHAVSPTSRLSHARPRRSWIAAEAAARRHAGPRPVFEPGQARDGRRPRIAVGLDTSGSITDQTLKLFAAEVLGVARRTGAEVHVFCFDETVHHRAEVTPGAGDSAIVNAPLRREGGTAYLDVMAEAVTLNPSIIVILTDLDGVFGPAPGVEVVWATPLAIWAEPPFGRVLSMAR